MTVTIETLSGAALTAALPDLARLRIAVFRDWPYLYDGDMAYEEGYVRAYAESPGAVVIGARADGRLVGAATAAPMAEHDEAFAAPLRAAGHEPAAFFYFGESVLLPDYRGHGIGHAFFDRREDAARAQRFRHACFCAVIRPADHPLRPAGARALEPFWRARGYAPLEGVTASFNWKDVGEETETAKPMQFWARTL
ncbi:MAG: GNAT family N-acetyltransferase [Rhodobacteraceae bacterium]|nr:GNAT family N-acetyltransferase [Paracoccaceae bacterium]